jgi:hypothetical protein
MSADIIAFSHIRWDFVNPRPKHILQLMARTRRVFYIEEPVFTKTYKVHFELFRPAPGVTVCRPQMPSRVPGFAGQNIPPLRNLLGDLIDVESIDSWVAWFYSPMALPILGHRKPSVIVNDRRDRLSEEPEPAEEELINPADLILTGGRKLYEERKGRSSNLQGIPSGAGQEPFGPPSWDWTVAVVEGLLGEVEGGTAQDDRVGV